MITDTNLVWDELINQSSKSLIKVLPNFKKVANSNKNRKLAIGRIETVTRPEIY